MSWVYQITLLSSTLKETIVESVNDPFRIEALTRKFLRPLPHLYPEFARRGDDSPNRTDKR